MLVGGLVVGAFTTGSALVGGRGGLVVGELVGGAFVTNRALVGGAIGAGLAWAAVGGLRAVAPADLPRIDAVRLDERGLLFALVVTPAAAAAGKRKIRLFMRRALTRRAVRRQRSG